MKKEIEGSLIIFVHCILMLQIATCSITKNGDVSWLDFLLPNRVYAKVGEDFILQCHNKENTFSSVTWYKVSIQQLPRLI